MWNPSPEWSQETGATLAATNSSEVLGSNVGPKRQRRPNVRLGEIGDPPAAVIPELYLKRKKQSTPFQTTSARQGDTAVNSEGNGTIDSTATHIKAAKVAKFRPVYFNNGGFHEYNSSNDDDYTHGNLRPADPVASLGVVPGQNHRLELNSDFQGGNNGRKAHQVFKGNKKGRNRKGRRAGPMCLAPFDKLTKEVSSVMEIDDNEYTTTDPHSDAGVPEGFKDSDFEASEYSKDAKENSNSQEVGLLDRGILTRPFVDYQQDYQCQQVASDHSLEQGQGPIEKSDEKGVTANNRARTKIRDMGGAASNRVGTIGSRREVFERSSDAEVEPWSQPKVRSLHQGKSKLMEVNGNFKNREPTSETTGLQLPRAQSVRHASSLVNGVMGWLQDLGLGRYAQMFETHEVDTEVLPLLTLDDLKEMGVAAVGTRRKMLYAIQQLGKGLMGRTDSF